MPIKEKYIGYFLAFSLSIIVLYLLSKQIKERHLQDDPMLHLLKDAILPLHPFFDRNYPSANIDLERLKLYRGEKSYTINKNQIFLCLYDDDDEYYPFNALLYVLLHELAHKANTEDIGHTEKFHIAFENILDESHRLGIYNPNIPMIKDYCGGDE